MSLTRNQLLIGLVGVTFAPLLWLYQFFFDIRMSEHSLLVLVAVLWWLLAMFYYLTGIVFSDRKDKEVEVLESFFIYLGGFNCFLVFSVVAFKILNAVFSL
jgi:hypothetical protein